MRCGGDTVNSENIIIAVITGVLTLLATKTTSRYELEKEQITSEAGATGIYVENMEFIMRGYKEQVSELRAEISGLKDNYNALHKDFEEFKGKYKDEILRYEEYVDVVKTQVQQLQDENEELIEENATLNELNIRLKGELEWLKN